MGYESLKPATILRKKTCFLYNEAIKKNHYRQLIIRKVEFLPNCTALFTIFCVGKEVKLAMNSFLFYTIYNKEY